MRKKIRQFAAGFLAAVLCFGCAAYATDGVSAQTITDQYTDIKMRVGLAYDGNSTGSLVSANLWNVEGYGSGFRFGYYDDNLEFITLGYTDQSQITMTKAKTLYLLGTNFYDEVPEGSHRVLGGYHLQLPAAFADYETARITAQQYSGGFVAWADGSYYVRVNSYAAAEAAFSDASYLGLVGWNVVSSSEYAVNVVVYATTDILFQFDGGANLPLGIMPGMDDSVKTLALFKGFHYHGGFRYERLDGGNITVVNILPLDDYVKGVVPYESNKLWPLETLKAQAICAKNYALTDLNKHDGHNFDVCNHSDCQVYWGNGNERVHPSELSDRAVDETRGIYAWYNGKLARTFFCSSNGGGTEDVVNVWGGTGYPYLAGVVDPFEADVADVANYYNWSYSFTAQELTAILQERGYAVGTTVDDFRISEYSATGNVLAMKFTYTNGTSNTFITRNSSWLRNKLGCRSLHFTVAGGGQEMPQGMAVNDGTGTKIEQFVGVYALGADGSLVQLQEEIPYVIVGSGEVVATSKPSIIPKGTFVITGTGWGHNIGYSQWGGYAMALQGYTYDEILKFYYTGIEVGPKS